MLDHDQDMLLKLRGARFKSYGEKFLPQLDLASQLVGNVLTNVRTFLARDFHMKSGMKFLIESFYRSISDGTPLPISYREILLTARIMDSIFEQLANGAESATGSGNRRIARSSAGSAATSAAPTGF